MYWSIQIKLVQKYPLGSHIICAELLKFQRSVFFPLDINQEKAIDMLQ